MEKFSFSRLQLYETCPKRFYYKYIKKLPDDTNSKPLALGTAVHKALELIVNGTDFNEAIKQGYIECDFHPEVTLEEIQELVGKAPLQKLRGQTEVYFCLPLFNYQGSPMLQGYIDLVCGNTIVDFKTNRKMYGVGDNHQIALYSWALAQKEGYGQVLGSLMFLRFRKESSSVFGEARINEALEWARGLVNEIRFKLDVIEFAPDKQNEVFPYQASSACEHCPFVLECYKENKYKGEVQCAKG